MGAAKEQTFVLEDEVRPVVRIPCPPADPPPPRRTTRPDRSPDRPTCRCGAVRRSLVDDNPERHSEGEDPRESSSLPDDPIIWPDPSPLTDWGDRVLGRPSAT
ncbi:MAG: hypothetical protein WAW17_12690 [Rhodococcus sp. (in: high G+C Gram-positive bacteria)]|uniref:hypothetical protein n=1 Tax=Rhodococcus sp. TaxID=1831 RepID=UPI003BB20BD5